MDKRRALFAAAGIFAFLALFYLLYRIFINRETLLDFVEDRRILGPLIIIALHIVQSVVFFLPGNVISFSAGYIFGFRRGFLLNFTGTLIGTAILFFVARKASKFFGYSGMMKAELAPIRAFFDGHSKRAAYVLAKTAPFIPSDSVTIFVASFTRNDFAEFMLFGMIGALPKIALDTIAGTFVKRYGLGRETLMFAIGVAVFLIAGLVWQRIETARKGKATRR